MVTRLIDQLRPFCRWGRWLSTPIGDMTQFSCPRTAHLSTFHGLAETLLDLFLLRWKIRQITLLVSVLQWEKVIFVGRLLFCFLGGDDQSDPHQIERMLNKVSVHLLLSGKDSYVLVFTFRHANCTALLLSAGAMLLRLPDKCLRLMKVDLRLK